MKYYVTYTEIDDGAVHKNVTGARFKKNKDMRHCVYFIDQKYPGSALYTEDQLIEKLYNAPMTKLQAKRYFNELMKRYPNAKGKFQIKEYPEEVSLTQFGAFIRW